MYHLEIMIISMIFDQIIQYQSEKSQNFRIHPSKPQTFISTQPDFWKSKPPFLHKPPIFLPKRRSGRPKLGAHLARRFMAFPS